MGIVKISDTLHDSVRTASTALSRSINAQAEHWLRVGMLAELHPQLTYTDICQLLMQQAAPLHFALTASAHTDGSASRQRAGAAQ